MLFIDKTKLANCRQKKKNSIIHELVIANAKLTLKMYEPILLADESSTVVDELVEVYRLLYKLGELKLANIPEMYVKHVK